jgi:hypothetical protein
MCTNSCDTHHVTPINEAVESLEQTVEDNQATVMEHVPDNWSPTGKLYRRPWGSWGQVVFVDHPNMTTFRRDDRQLECKEHPEVSHTARTATHQCTLEETDGAMLSADTHNHHHEMWCEHVRSSLGGTGTVECSKGVIPSYRYSLLDREGVCCETRVRNWPGRGDAYSVLCGRKQGGDCTGWQDGDSADAEWTLPLDEAVKSLEQTVEDNQATVMELEDKNSGELYYKIGDLWEASSPDAFRIFVDHPEFTSFPRNLNEERLQQCAQLDLDDSHWAPTETLQCEPVANFGGRIVSGRRARTT